MKSRIVTVHCVEGLHMRIASQVAKIAKRCGGAVHILRKGCVRVNACSVMEVMLLGAVTGTPLEIIADGPEEENVLRDLTELIELDTAC